MNQHTKNSNHNCRRIRSHSLSLGLKGYSVQRVSSKGEGITQYCYFDTLLHLHNTISQKQLGLLSRGVVLIHNNVTTNKVTLMKGPNFSWGVFLQPPFLPDIAPSNFMLFVVLKNDLDGKLIQSFNRMEKWKHLLSPFLPTSTLICTMRQYNWSGITTSV